MIGIALILSALALQGAAILILITNIDDKLEKILRALEDLRRNK